MPKTMLQDLSQIKQVKFTDPQMESLFTMLLNVVEIQQKEIQDQKKVIQELRDEISRLKGEQGKPSILPSTKKQDISSEKHKQPAKDWKKESKKDKMTFDRQVVCPLNREHLPSDLVFKGNESVVSQDIVFERHNTEYLVEMWYSPSENKTYRAALPSEYTGYFGNSLKTFCIVMHHGLDVTHSKLIRFLDSIGVSMSAGSLQSILTEKASMWIAEKRDLLRSGLRSLFLQTDSTGARVNGQNCRTHVILSEFFTIYSTMPGKSRLDILRALQGEPESGLLLSCNGSAMELLAHYRISVKDKAHIAAIFAEKATLLQSEFEAIIKQRYSKMADKPHTFKSIIEALALGYYFEQSDFPAPKIILTDDAKEYSLLASVHSLCWVHDARYYNKLMPVLECHQAIVKNFQAKYWEFYEKLKEYSKNPSLQVKQQLYLEFDTLFVDNTQYFNLDAEIRRTLSNKSKLLAVLEYPFVPLHNNAAELAARVQVRKRDISLHTVTKLGTQLQDAFLSIIQTSFKIGINAYKYIEDRLNGTSDTYLPDLVRLKMDMK